MVDIYEEALADRKKLLEVAESNAKSKIVDAITPRIKELVESAILGKLTEDIGEDNDDILLGVVDVDDSVDPLADPALPTEDPMAPGLGLPVDPVAPAAPLPGAAVGSDVAGGDPAGLSLPGHDGKVTIDIDSLASPSASTFELTPESLQVLNTLIGTRRTLDVNTLPARVKRMEETFKKISQNRVPSIKDRESARQLRVECERLFADIQHSRDFLDESVASTVESKLEKLFKRVMEKFSAAGHLEAIVKEMMAINKKAGAFAHSLKESQSLKLADVKAYVAMMKQTMELHRSVKKLYESLGTDDSVDAPTVQQVGKNLATLYAEIRKMVTKKGKQINEADELDVGDDAGIPAGDGAEVDAEKVLVQLELPASLMDIAAGDQVSVVDVSPAGAEDDLGGEPDASGVEALDDIGLDGEEAIEEPGEDMENMDDMDDDMVESESGSIKETRLNDDDIIEIDEAALVAEVQNLKKLREKKYQIRHGGHGPGDLSDFGGGKDEGEKFVDGQDLNQEDPSGSDGYLEEGDEDLDESDDDLEEADDVEDEEAVEESKARGTARRKVAQKNGRSNGKQLAEAFEKARAELAEQKLFNTKLVALNRVLQIPGLKQVQKEKIVEVLDKGRTIAEVQQLYGKIVEALKKDPKAIKESADKSSKGSGSKVTTSTAPSVENESHPLLEKWNKIAFGGSGLIQG